MDTEDQDPRAETWSRSNDTQGQGAKLSLKVPDGLGKGSAWTGACVLEPRSLMVSFPWCRQDYPLKTPLSSCFPWPHTAFPFHLSKIQIPYQGPWGPNQASDLCAPCIWCSSHIGLCAVPPRKAHSCLRLLNCCSLHLNTLSWNGHMDTPSLGSALCSHVVLTKTSPTICGHHSPLPRSSFHSSQGYL